jgi:5-oxoprolinase (ATP-hydrolysing) subunit A
MRTIDLNADLGEGGQHDEALMALTSSVNIACGGHAGDRKSIRQSVELATQAQVAIGAHPGYEDPGNFGRKPMLLCATEIRDLILRQLERFMRFHPQPHHVKPHGALYNQANQDPVLAEALVAAVAELLPHTILYCPPQGALAFAANRIHLPTCPEGFIDRRYQEDGNLCPRSENHALIEHIDDALSQALEIALQHTVQTLNGTTIPIKARTLCVHGDSPDPVHILKHVRSSLEAAGIMITAP